MELKDILIELKVNYKQRIDKYIANNSEISRNDIKNLILNKTIFCNNINVRKGNFQVKKNDKILITKKIEKEIKAEPQNIKIEIVYEDKDLIVVNKKSGMVVHPAPGNLKNTLVNALLYKFNNLSNINGKIRPGIVHRIDKDTSGLLIVAKNNKSHQFLANQLKEHKIQRIYYALVEGKIENKVLHINLPIGRDSKNRKKMSITTENSKHAITHVYVEKIINNLSLIRCELETGRTHQIRVHLSYIGHPILGDELYGKKIDNFGQRLHAYKIIFIHPTTKQKLIFKTQIPNEFNL